MAQIISGLEDNPFPVKVRPTLPRPRRVLMSGLADPFLSHPHRHDVLCEVLSLLPHLLR